MTKSEELQRFINEMDYTLKDKIKQNRKYASQVFYKNKYTLEKIVNDLEKLEKLEKVIEILKENKITALKLTWDGTWWTIDVPKNKNFYPVVYGKGKENYDLLKEVLKNGKEN